MDHARSLTVNTGGPCPERVVQQKVELAPRRPHDLHPERGASFKTIRRRKQVYVEIRGHGPLAGHGALQAADLDLPRKGYEMTGGRRKDHIQRTACDKDGEGH